MFWVQWPTIVMERHVGVKDKRVLQFNNDFLVSLEKDILLLILVLLLDFDFFFLELLGKIPELLGDLRFIYFDVFLLVAVGFLDGNFLFDEGFGAIDEFDESIPGVSFSLYEARLPQSLHFGGNVVLHWGALEALLAETPVLPETVPAEQEVEHPVVGSIHFEGAVHLAQEGQLGLTLPANLLLLPGGLEPSG